MVYKFYPSGRTFILERLVDMKDIFDYTRWDSDLACERRRADTALDGVHLEREISAGGVWERIRITDEEGAKSIGRPIGHYDTLTIDRMDLLDGAGISDGAEEIARELCRLVEGLRITPDRLLVIGLGNRELTPDSIGPRCADEVNATLHIAKEDVRFFSLLECSEIAVLSPGVKSYSGMDAAELVKGICDRSHPNAVIAIDALCARSPSRLGRTVQLSDTGIFPGSGIGNPRGAITKETVGVPVIAIGVPTVIDARAFSGRDATADSEALFVSPKEINGIVKAAARMISGGINQAFGIDTQ